MVSVRTISSPSEEDTRVHGGGGGGGGLPIRAMIFALTLHYHNLSAIEKFKYPLAVFDENLPYRLIISM